MKRNAFKKFALMIVFLISFAFVLSGCNLFERNWYEYYNAVVVSIEYPDGEKIEIDKRELLTAFDNYGKNLVANYNYTYKDAVNQTLTQLINQKVKLRIAEDEVAFSNAEKNKLYKDTLLEIKDYLQSYVEDVRKDWNLSEASIIDEEEESKDIVLYTPYQPKVEIEEDGNGVKLVLIENKTIEIEEDLEFDFMSDVFDKNKIVQKIYEYVMNQTKYNAELNSEYEKENARVFKESLKRFTNNLRTVEEGLKLSKDDEGVLKRMLLKFYENKLDNLLLTKMSEIITPVSKYASVTVAEVLSKYQSMVRQSYEKYAYNHDALKGDMLENFANVNYYGSYNDVRPEQEYFFVSHFLLQFTEEQSKKLEDLEKKKELGGTADIGIVHYVQERQKIIDSVPVVERSLETGEVIENSTIKRFSQVMELLETAYYNANDFESKVSAFKNILYRFNQDPGIMNSEYLYVIGTEDSKMDKEFTRVARELHQQGNLGAYSLEPAISTYGVHILFYAGEVANSEFQYMPYQFANLNSVNFPDEDIYTLRDTLLNPFNNKTLLDKVFESVQSTRARESETAYLNTMKKELKITKYTSNYKDLMLD